MVKTDEKIGVNDVTNAKEIAGKEKEKGCTCDDGKDKLKRIFEFDPILLRYRVFYFLFFAGFGTTFPYLGIYFKQIGLNAASVGILAGVRPLIQFVSGPFWSILADKYRARKVILLFSIFSWLVMTVVLVFPRPHDVVCKKVNATQRYFKGSSGTNGQKKDHIPSVTYNGHIGELLLPVCLPQCKKSTNIRNIRSIDTRKNILSYLDGNDQSLSRYNQTYIRHDIKVETSLNDNLHNKAHSPKSLGNRSNVTTPEKSDKIQYIIQHNPEEIKTIFIVLLMLIIAGEFLEAPSFIMTDTALLEYLGENRTNYGKTRLFGSIGYGAASFGIGAILDRTRYVYCGKNMIDYTFLFYIFAAFMVIGFFFALFAVDFSYEKKVNTKSPTKEVLQLFCSLKIATFVTLTWFLGFSHGGIMNFLNWYLEDLGATRFMMGIGTLCRSFAIIFGFLTSNYFVNKFGHMNMILCVLVAYTFSFFGYSVVPNPWYALPIEFGQGFCYSISWSASITYLGAVAPKNAEATVQGILQGVYWGLGTGIGAFVGGAVINKFGAIKSFRMGGILSAVVVFFLLIVNHIVNHRDKKEIKENVATKLKDITSVISSSK